ncbi:HAD family hydrolase [Jannaschia ovalis]|uniref:phosphoglycolate phosphatase n=1 Tax=Jannaschia ovalis TaxID=3038773 RepID=A0ABY8LFH8_9RHOB|nr:HAD family hydrolase [Jannaschia sp. GRR-S6-38]WGH78943.1 HAD family hydrolase [Jannaschia sp. GRR-S6-38]
MIRAILFDKDGTLTDFRRTWEAWIPGTIRALARATRTDAALLAEIFGVDLAAGRIRPDGRFVTATHHETVDLLAPATGWSPEALAAWWDAATLSVEQVPVTPLDPFLAGLRRRGLALGVITNAVEAEAHYQLAGLGAAPHLDRVIACDSGFGAKPDPAGARDFAARLGLDPAHVALVGDGLTDMGAARGAGMLALGVTTGTLDAAALAPHADHVLPDITALPAWLDARAAA